MANRLEDIDVCYASKVSEEYPLVLVQMTNKMTSLLLVIDDLEHFLDLLLEPVLDFDNTSTLTQNSDPPMRFPLPFIGL